jgi:hypothetical protein
VTVLDLTQLNRAYKSSIKMHLYHAQQSEKKRRFSFSETEAGSAVQAALAKTYLHMMDPTNKELSREIKETREDVRPLIPARVVLRQCRWGSVVCARPLRHTSRSLLALYSTLLSVQYGVCGVRIV